MLSAPPQPPRFERAWFHAALASAALAGLFIVAVSVALIAGVTRPAIPLMAEELDNLRRQVHQAPDDDDLKHRIRALDAQIRGDHQRWRRRAELGPYLLLGGAIVLLLSLKTVAAHRPRLPPVPPTDVLIRPDRAQHAATRWAMLGTTFLVMGAAGVMALRAAAPGASPWDEALAKAQALAVTVPSLEEYRRHWPRFRGPDGSGVIAAADVPRDWDGPTGRNVLWKSPVPLPGANSPVVWGDRVFLSGADEKRREVYCFDANTGRLLWSQAVDLPRAGTGATIDVYQDTTHAAPTMAANGVHVAALFTTGELACFDLAGNLQWSRRLEVTDNPYGHATSLLFHGPLLLVQVDRGSPASGQSLILAIDASTGRTAWQAKRPVGASWATPIVIEHAGRTQLITVADPWIIAYNPEDGTELWRARCVGGEVASSPVFAQGMIIASNPWMDLAAVRADGSGDVTSSHLAWRGGDNAPDITSPIVAGDLLFTLSSAGTLTCADLNDGSTIWSHDLGLEFHASPSLVDDRLYLLADDGTMIQVAAERRFSELGRSQLGEECRATPAFAPGRIFIRGLSHLYCIAADAGGAP